MGVGPSTLHLAHMLWGPGLSSEHPYSLSMSLPPTTTTSTTTTIHQIHFPNFGVSCCLNAESRRGLHWPSGSGAKILLGGTQEPVGHLPRTISPECLVLIASPISTWMQYKGTSLRKSNHRMASFSTQVMPIRLHQREASLL